MDAVAIFGALFGIASLFLSVYNTILVKSELLYRRRLEPGKEMMDSLDKARALHPHEEIQVPEDDYDSPWEKEPENEMEELLR